MKNKRSINLAVILAAFLLASGSSFAQMTTEEDLAKSVFETIKNNNSEALSFLCISAHKMETALQGVSDTSHMAKSVISDLKQANPESMKYEVINNFDLFITEIQTENLSLEDARFEGVTMNKIKFDISNLKAKKVTFNVSFSTIKYDVRIYLFQTKNDTFIYGFSFAKEA